MIDNIFCMLIWKCHRSNLNIIVWEVRQSVNSVMEIDMISNDGKLNCSFSKTFDKKRIPSAQKKVFRVTAIKCKVRQQIDRNECLGILGIKTVTYGTNTLSCLFMPLYNALNYSTLQNKSCDAQLWSERLKLPVWRHTMEKKTEQFKENANIFSSSLQHGNVTIVILLDPQLVPLFFRSTHMT